MRIEWVRMVAEQLKQNARKQAQTEEQIVDIRDRITRVESDLAHLREATRQQETTLARIAEAASPTQLKELVAQVAKHEQTLTRIMVAAVVAQLFLGPVIAGLVSLYMAPKPAPAAAKVEKGKQ